MGNSCSLRKTRDDVSRSDLTNSSRLRQHLHHENGLGTAGVIAYKRNRDSLRRNIKGAIPNPPEKKPTMSSFPGSPQVLKGGAISRVDPANPLASLIIFQYCPDTMTRALRVQTTSSDNADRGEALQLKGPPPETNELTVEIDAESEFKQPNIGTFVPSQKQESRWTGKCCSLSREKIRGLHNP
jgi:hypothetical protein